MESVGLRRQGRMASSRIFGRAGSYGRSMLGKATDRPHGAAHSPHSPGPGSVGWRNHSSRLIPALRNNGSVARRSLGTSLAARLGETSHLPAPGSQVAAVLPTIQSRSFGHLIAISEPSQVI
jgi:hypothetical protein